jgi:hypothetical protein
LGCSQIEEAIIPSNLKEFRKSFNNVWNLITWY